MVAERFRKAPTVKRDLLIGSTEGIPLLKVMSCGPNESRGVITVISHTKINILVTGNRIAC